MAKKIRAFRFLRSWRLCVPLGALLLLFPGSSLGQTNIPDTLDWHGYFPLRVGNLWEYQHMLFRPQTFQRPVDESEIRHEHYPVVDSTARGDTLLYVIEFEERNEQNGLIRRDTLHLWYDEDPASLRAERLTQVLDWLRCLNSPFNLDLSAHIPPPCWPFVGQDELFVPDLFGAESVRVKAFGSFVWGFATVHGVGVISGGGGCEPCGAVDDRDEWRVKYARIGHKAYGSQIVSTERNTVVETPRLVAYPNPTSGRLTLEAPAGEQLEVYDILGRRVRIERINQSGRVIIDLSNLASGVYVLKVGLQSQKIILR